MHLSASAIGPAGTSRHEQTVKVYGCVEKRSSAAKYRLQRLRCPGVQVGCEKSELTPSKEELRRRCNRTHKNFLKGICYRRCTPIESGESAPKERGHKEKWLNVPYSLDSSRKSS